ncbi:MAG TPA: amidohydrolase family protein [Nocardioides sp.]|uniref:amidohydrolase family protein n=1 Tax=uncultured Nocardioides sp. TaxID=198441 RepID=UPI000EE4F52E|nr:amidohydrolase family protein [uncultured Nocardioides sp.]HCB07470.1 amidohydrolase [Nocardioides sp.]HRD59449.1 amidohydrolase family protein [Nocardioides sp.]HRI94526.1 amidohydrolase family protein [Nocardioides sp.]HRK45090.1 amidohydrolase family protein [Nocardioides sp.]
MSVQTREQSETRRQKLDDVLVVDTDVHVYELPKDLIDYIDMPWQVALEQVKDRSGNFIPAFAPGASGFSFGPIWPTSHESDRIVRTPEAMREELTNINVDIGILFPNNLLKLPTLTDDEYAAALTRAYNAWLADTWCLPDQGLLGVLCACPHAPDDTAAEIRKYAKHPGMVGVYLPSAAVDPLWGSRKYDPIYEACEEADFAVLLHSVGIVHPAYPFNTHGFTSGFARHATSHTFSMMANLVDMISTGVPERFPKLRIAFTEAGVAWVPFLMMRMDRIYRERRHEVPFLTKPPSEYMTSFYYATQPIEEPQNLRDLVTLVDLYQGDTQTIFASDWPHHDFDHPNKIFQAPFSDDVRRKIFGENALRLLNLDANGQRLGLSSAPS